MPIHIDWIVALVVFIVFVSWSFGYYANITAQRTEILKGTILKYADTIQGNLAVAQYSIPIKVNSTTATGALLYFNASWPNQNSTQVYSGSTLLPCNMTNGALYWGANLAAGANYFTVKFNDQNTGLQCNSTSLNASAVAQEVSNTSDLVGWWKFDRTPATFELSNTSGLVGFWKLNNDSAYGESDTLVYDYSGNGHNGTPQGGAAFNSSGYFNGSYSFDGVNDYITLGSNGLGDVGGTNFTIEAWVKTSAAANYNMVLTEFQAGVCGDAVFGVYPSGPNGVVHFDDGLGTVNNGDVNVADGNWHHIAYVRTATNGYTYVDGVQGADTTYSNWRNACNVDVQIGKRADGYPFTGSIDSLRVYNRSLSQTEITENYLNASGTHDNSGYGNDATTHTSNPTNISGGKFNDAYNFNGINDYINIPASSSLDQGQNGSFTYEAWIKTSDKTTAHTIIRYDNGSLALTNRTAIALRTLNTTGKVRFTAVALDWNLSNYVDSISDVVDGNWHHIAGIRSVSEGKLKIYIDGVLENETTDVSNASFTSNPPSPVVIGARLYTSGNHIDFFNGSIDSVRIYNRALSSTEILANYNGTGGTAQSIQAIPWTKETSTGISQSRISQMLSTNYNDFKNSLGIPNNFKITLNISGNTTTYGPEPPQSANVHSKEYWSKIAETGQPVKTTILVW